jgi:peptidoglycan/LPS O-acetylase OafA/YrhL
MASGQWLLANRSALLVRAMPRAASPLSWLGRWSLSWYMVHQPVMIGALMALKALR